MEARRGRHVYVAGCSRIIGPTAGCHYRRIPSGEPCPHAVANGSGLRSVMHIHALELDIMASRQMQLRQRNFGSLDVWKDVRLVNSRWQKP
jgi:hypothetical protein